MRKVLEGKAVLRVVDVEATTVPAAATVSVSNTLTSPSTSPKWTGAASSSSLGQSRSAGTSTEDRNKTSLCKASCVCEILEESMRSLSVKKKM